LQKELVPAWDYRIKAPYTSSTSGLADGIHQCDADTPPTHLWLNPECADNTRVHDRLETDYSRDGVADRSRDPADGRLFEASRDHSGRIADCGEQRLNPGHIGSLADVKLTGCARSPCSYFLGAGNSCAPVSSSTTTMAFAGHARAAARIAASDAPVGL